ncbi:ATP-dependent helicase [Gordonia sp. NPDC127522]|uniref:ATP-dependent helicase n=1 Tax=Gordonia sp. NPDC127522 TaxID=3345390 RepID=UPI00362EFF8F
MPYKGSPEDPQPPLSDEQLTAVMAAESAMAVIASAGSGKTEVVARRAQRLLQESTSDGQKILALSYTKKAADELRSRLSERLGALASRVETDTVHGFAYTIIREHGTKIGLPVEPELLTRDEDRAELLTRWLEDQGASAPNDIKATLRDLDIRRARNQGGGLVDEWEAALSNSRALDYPALLSAAQKLFEVKSTRRQISRVYGHLIVDEAQNLTPAQYDLLTALIGEPSAANIQSVMLVGDDKQSIVSFAGADPRLINKFIVEYGARTYYLSANFRSAIAISRLAHTIAQALGHRNSESVETHNQAPGSVLFNEARDEEHEGEIVAAWVDNLISNGLPRDALAPSDVAAITAEEIAILGRSATALRQVAQQLTARGIPWVSSSGADDWLDSTPGKIVFEIIGLRAANRHQSVHWQLARLLGVDSSLVTHADDLYTQLKRSTDPTVAMLAPLCGAHTLGEFVATLERLPVPSNTEYSQLASWQADVNQLRESWIEFDQSVDRNDVTWSAFKLFCSRQQRGDDLAPGVRLLTIHKAQGREFRAVALVGMNDGQIPDFRAQSAEETRAELRTFYVAVTRARRALLLTRSQSRATQYGTRRTSPSPFLGYLRSS